MWKQRLLQVNAASGMEIVFLQQQQLIINVVTAKNKNNKIVKDWFRQGMKSFDELKDVNKKLPVCLVLNGKGVLTKKVRMQAEENPVLLVFPQANPAEFYYQVLQDSFVSIARKSLVDEAINKVQQAGFRVLDVSLGFSAIEPLLPFIAQDEFSTTSYCIQGKVNSFEPCSINQFQQPEYLISQQYLQAYDLLAFAAATGLLIGTYSIDHETLHAQREEFKYRTWFKAGALSLLVLVFGLLLINFFVYNYYYQENSRFVASGHVAVPKKEFIQDKEQFLQQHKWLQQPRSSFFADRLAGFLPEGVWFSSLQIRTDTIQLNGECHDPDRINLLINNIKTMKEVKEVVMKNYVYKKEEDIGAFSIDIFTK